MARPTVLQHQVSKCGLLKDIITKRLIFVSEDGSHCSASRNDLPRELCTQKSRPLKESSFRRHSCGAHRGHRDGQGHGAEAGYWARGRRCVRVCSALQQPQLLLNSSLCHPCFEFARTTTFLACLLNQMERRGRWCSKLCGLPSSSPSVQTSEELTHGMVARTWPSPLTGGRSTAEAPGTWRSI